MKKLVTLLAVVVLAMATHAASFSWKLSTGATYAGMNVYAITGSSAADILAVCQGSDSDAWASIVEGMTFATAASGTRGTAQGVSANIAANDSINFLIVDGSIQEGSAWYVTADNTIPAANVFEPPATGAQKTIAVSLAGQGTFASVPEPTSGLLLLLGMAGLALKRKQA